MTPHPQREYEPVDWHGEHLHIDQDKNGRVTVSHPPFETHFDAEEMREISQFINKYCASHSSAKSESAVLDDRMIAWIREGDRGISSEVIFEVLANHPLLETELDFSTPEDASDFNRCHELILRIPEWENRLNEVSEKHRHWKLIIERWQELKTCLINDIADDGRSCNRLLNELNKYRYAPEKYEELRSKTKDRGDR